MKLAFVNTTKSWGGGEKWHLENAIALRNRGHEVVIIAKKNSELIKRASQNSIKTIELKLNKLSFLNPFKIAKICDQIRENNFNKIIINSSIDLKVFGFASILSGFKGLIYRRGSALPVKSNVLNRFLINNALSSLIVNSEATKSELIGKGDLISDKSKIHLIYNGLEIQEAFEKKESSKLILGNVGRMVEQKGQHYLIDLSIKLNQLNVDHILKIVGSGKLESDLKARAANNPNIEFLGFKDDLRSFYSGLDIFVLSSKWEGFGYVIAEAMHEGTPVVAFNLSSNPELIENNVNGLLIEPFDIDTMAKKIKALYEDKELLKKMGITARDTIKTNFNKEKSIDKLEQLILN